MKTNEIMKINTKNLDKLNKALDETNGKASGHTFTGSELKAIGVRIKKHLNEWFTLDSMKGICGFATSGDQMPNAYKYSRSTNRVAWEVGSAGNVFITNINRTTSWNEGGRIFFLFTDDQEKTIATIAVNNARKL